MALVETTTFSYESPERESIWGGFVAQYTAWRTEFPAITRGLWQLTAPFRPQLAKIAFFNTLIAIWDTAQPWIIALCVDQLVDKAPFRTIILVIIFPVLAIALPYGIVLPLFRELYTLRHFRPWLMKHLSMRCFEGGGCAFRNKGPIAQLGRDITVPLVDSFLRDPLYIVRGLVLLVWLSYLSPSLGLILASGMVFDVIITMWMEIRIKAACNRQQQLNIRIKGLENDIWDGGAHPRSKLELERLWTEYALLTKSVETKRLMYQSVLREGCAQVVRIGLMLLVGWWVHLGETTVGQYFIFVQLAGRSNDPLYVFFNLQQVLMQNRDPLRRFGAMLGVPLLGDPVLAAKQTRT
jgi:ABC-type bacteriocin/lantibiotic exporter with double-glycine peptidase domain